MSLVQFAKKELEMAGLFDKDSDYGGMLGESTMKLIKCFADEGHSGFSASMQIQIFNKLANWKPLTPLTDNPEEWMEVGNEEKGILFQSRRSPDCFSYDAGKTYYSVDDDLRAVIKSEPFNLKGEAMSKPINATATP